MRQQNPVLLGLMVRTVIRTKGHSSCFLQGLPALLKFTPQSPLGTKGPMHIGTAGLHVFGQLQKSQVKPMGYRQPQGAHSSP